MESQKFSFESMGTSFEVSVWDEINSENFEVLGKEIFQMADKFDKKYSRFIRSSFVWEIAGKTGEFEVEDEFMEMLKVYFDLYKFSDKKFNPLIGFSISDMGYDDKYSLVEKEHIRPTPDLDYTIKVLGKNKIYISESVLFDFGGVGKGYFVDKISKYLKEKNIKKFMVNGSGDIFYSGNGEKIKAGLEDPKDNKKVIGTIEIENGALAASGSEKRKWGKYHHIIDPQSLTSPSGILATWVLAESATIADSLATCLFLCPPENFIHNFKFEFCILNKDYKTKNSAGFKAEFF